MGGSLHLFYTDLFVWVCVFVLASDSFYKQLLCLNMECNMEESNEVTRFIENKRIKEKKNGAVAGSMAAARAGPSQAFSRLAIRRCAFSIKGGEPEK